MSHWGSYRDDESIHKFQSAIRQIKPPVHLATQYDTQLANAVVADRDVWSTQCTTLPHKTHYKTQIQYKYSMRHTSRHGNQTKITFPVFKLHACLRSWYTHTHLPPALTPELPNTSAPYTPRHQDGWSCAPHMLIVSLSAIYHGAISILPYSQMHTDQLSRMLLRYVIMGELPPRIDIILTHLSGLGNNAVPEPFNEHYNAGGTTLVREHLEENRKKTAPKTQHLPRTKFGGQAAQIELHTEGMPPNTYPIAARPPPTPYHMDTRTKP